MKTRMVSARSVAATGHARYNTGAGRARGRRAFNSLRLPAPRPHPVRRVAVGVPGALLALITLAACSSRRPPEVAGDEPPAWMLGTFVDDYGNRYTISRREWTQHPSRYLIMRWAPAEGYLIARNDSANAGDGGRWTRIDWVGLPGMAPYEWAFCYTAYAATSAAEAESTPAALRDTPRTGCNGYPFSRMRRDTRDQPARA